jgi:mono/diheme cytochrome c family protein
MKLRYRLFLLLPVLLLSLMIALGKGDATKGKTVFNRCAICHGSSGDGNEAIGKALGVKMPVLGSQEIQALEDAAVKKIILEGKGKMQALKLSDEEIEDVLAFVRSLKKPSQK